MKHVMLFLILTIFYTSAQESSETPKSVAETKQDSIISAEKSGLSITGTPDSINVKINGIERGITPITISDLPNGEHTVVLTKKGYYGKKITVTTKQDSLVEIDAELRAPGSVTITSNPEGALIFMNKKKIDKTPFTISTVRPGSHSIMLLRGGYAQFDTTIEVESGANDTIAIEMISSNPVPAVAETKPVVNSTVAATDSVVTNNGTAPVTDENSEPKRKKIFKIVGSAIVATFLTAILISELSGDEN